MFATAITAWRRSQPDIRSRSPTQALHPLDTGRIAAPLESCRIDRVDQRPRRRQPLNSQAVGPRRYTAVGPLLGHGDPPPPLDLTHEEQTSALALRKQHHQALPTQRMERVSDHQ